jgi:hypothetical protein
LSELANIASPPALLGATDPVIVHVEEREDSVGNVGSGTRIRLEATTETLADIPQVALDAIGLTGPLPRTAKPWLAPSLKADGSPRE